MQHSPTTTSQETPTTVGEGRGVGLQRKFTQAGVHPFDAVEWEIRDAGRQTWARPSIG